jgi:hypothetical protein
VYGRVDRLLRELNKKVIPLAMNNLLVHVKSVDAVIHDIHALVCAMAHEKDTPEHLQDARISTGGSGGTTTTGSARSHIRSKRGVTVD